jgi:microcystin-dependent protein
MTQPFLGQVQPFAFNFPPLHWAFCDGQLLSISQNTALFALLGTFYGGNGTSTFALPDLRGRVPMHQGTLPGGQSYVPGELAGTETVTLFQAEMPAHTHSFSGTSSPANWKPPVTGSAYAQSNKAGTSPADAYYAPDTSPQITSLHIDTVTPYGQQLPHTNIQPYLTINWCICIAGIFPSRN